MLNARFFLAVALCTCGIALSQQPAPRSGEDIKKPDAQAAEAEQHPRPDIRGTKQSPLVVETLPAPKSEAQTRHEHYEHHEKPTLDRWLTGATVALALITLGLAIFTAFLWGATRRLVLETTNTARTELRAYVKMSHYPPGIEFEDTGRATMRIQVKNFGKTPATLARIKFGTKVLPKDVPLPLVADFSSGIDRAPDIFLAAQEDFAFPHRFDTRVDFKQTIQTDRNQVIWVYGCVEYIDAFNRHFESGYARRYNPRLDTPDRHGGVDTAAFKRRSNLELTSIELSGQRNYNYDRPRKQP